MTVEQPRLVAGGNIFPSRFLKMSGAYAVVFAAAATDFLIGIAHESIEDANGILGSSTYHRTSSSKEGVQYYAYGRLCLLEAGAAFSAGAKLTSDSVGRGVTASTSNYVGALALEAATAAGQLVNVWVLPPALTAAA